MSQSKPLLLSRRFAPLFWCQFFSAFSDNFLKNALVFLILFKIGGSAAESLITLAAAVVIDALARFIPGVLGEEKSLTHESFTSKLLDFPQYTRPAEFRGMSVPEVLLSGNHGEIEKWRHARQVEKTRQVRPDLLK